MIVGYVINLDRAKDRLAQFNRHPDAHYFTRIPALDKQVLDNNPNMIGFLFDDSILTSIYGWSRVSTGQMCCTLSHMMSWEAVANNNALKDDDYAVIAEDDILLVPNFSAALSTLINAVKPHDLNIVLLHKLGINSGYDCDGSTLYLLKKSFAKTLVERCKRSKPYWFADQFTTFCEPNKIAVSKVMLGEVPENNSSYIWDKNV